MGKLKSIFLAGGAALKTAGVVGLYTGHGVAAIVASAAKIRVPSPVVNKYASYQMKSAGKMMDKAIEEWKK